MKPQFMDWAIGPQERIERLETALRNLIDAIPEEAFDQLDDSEQVTFTALGSDLRAARDVLRSTEEPTK